MAEQKIRALFTEKSDLAISDIVKNFRLEESYEELMKKEEQDKNTNELAISLLAKEFTQGNISEANLILSLQKDIEISKETAEKISKEIINKVVPLLEKVPEEKLHNFEFKEDIAKKDEERPALSKTKEALYSKPLIDSQEKSKLSDEIILEDKNRTQEPLENLKTKKILPKKPIQPKPLQSKKTGPDSYREPIE